MDDPLLEAPRLQSMKSSDPPKRRIRKRWVAALCAVFSAVGYFVSTYGETIVSLVTRIHNVTSGN